MSRQHNVNAVLASNPVSIKSPGGGSGSGSGSGRSKEGKKEQERRLHFGLSMTHVVAYDVAGGVDGRLPVQAENVPKSPPFLPAGVKLF
jgi:hypothetical protein